MNNSPNEFEEGKVLLINKPLEWTSFDAVRKIRNTIRIRKVGHAGTLDPLATGLLIICTGKFTKKINEYMAKEKEYTGTITWISDKAEFTPKTIQTKEERANLVYAIKVKVKNDGFLKIGMYGEVKL